MINLNEYQDRNKIHELLAECMWPDDERVKRELDRYSNDDSKELLGKILNNELVGLIGVRRTQDDVELRHIAVKEPHRGKGIGKQMIYEYIQDNKIKRMEAETDKDAVDFYRRVGFEICSLGEKYPGRERFKCILQIKVF